VINSMALTLKNRSIYICHFCHEEFLDRSSLLSHFVHCSLSTRRLTNNHNPDEKLRLPRLTKTENEILQILKLRRLTSRIHRSKPTESSREKIQFGETFCTTDTSISSSNPLFDNENSSNNSNTKSTISSFHHYKYSRRERENFYTSVKRARLKKSLRKTRPLSAIQNHQGCLMIQVPTQINSRQRLNLNRNNSYPLLFDMNFHSLVSLSREKFFPNYIDEMNRYFHLIHSIASQEFQIIVHSHDHEQTFLPYSAFSFLHLLRQTMMNYSINLQKTSKRDYFQAFSTDQQQCNGTVKHPRLESTTTIRNQRDVNSPPIVFVEDEKSSIEPEPSIHLNHYRTQTDTKPVAPAISRQTSTKKSTDESSIRVTRQKSSISTDVATTNASPTLETKPVIMSTNKLSKEWLTNTVFYRCHACSHEEFFLVLSRECLNLHLSSQHANMQENFKQRLCHYLNNQGRAVKIFQHYLKWQQPWSEKQIEQIFSLSNSQSRTKSSINHRQ